MATGDKTRATRRRAGQVIPRGERVWLVRVFLGRDSSGRRRYLNRTVHGSKKDAQTILNTLLTDNDRGDLVRPSHETLDAFLDRWLNEVAAVRVRRTTFELYKNQLRLHIRPVLGNVRLSDLELSDFNRLYRAMEKRGLSSRTVRLTHAIVCRALEHGVEKDKRITRNPARLAELPPTTRPEIKPLDVAQVAKFYEVAAQNRLGVLLMFAVTTGMRPSEYLALRWTDIDFERSEAIVVRSIHRVGPGKWEFAPPKTKTSRRHVKFSAALAKMLRTHRSNQAKDRLAAGATWQDHDLVFCSTIGTPIDGRNLKRRHFKPLLAEAGLPRETRLYDLRHTMATILIDQKVDPKTVSERLGHSNVVTTLTIYTHPTGEMHERAAGRLEDLFFASPATPKKQES